MPDSQLHYCATDKELYYLLMASKQRITVSILLGFARERGIFCSPRESRESLVDYHAASAASADRKQGAD